MMESRTMTMIKSPKGLIAMAGLMGGPGFGQRSGLRSERSQSIEPRGSDVSIGSYVSNGAIAVLQSHDARSRRINDAICSLL